MKILAIEKDIENISGVRYHKVLKEEAQRVWELVQDGIIREIYFTKEDHSAVLILECENEETAKSVLDTLPLVKEKLITFKIITLVPYDGFSRLFK